MKTLQIKWSVKLRHLDWNKKNSRIVFVFAANRDEARKAALRIYEKTNGVDFSMYACESNKIKAV